MTVLKDWTAGPSIATRPIVAIEDVDVTTDPFDAGESPARAVKLNEDGVITILPANHTEDGDAIAVPLAGGVFHPITVRKILTTSTKKTGIQVAW